MNGQLAKSQFPKSQYPEELVPRMTDSQNLQDALNSHRCVVSNILDLSLKNSKQEYILHSKYSQGYIQNYVL